MNCMYDLTQFIVSYITVSTKRENHAETFMEDVVLTYWMVAILVIDVDSCFRGTFETMCKLLKLTFWPLSRGNHKGKSVEHYH